MIEESQTLKDMIQHFIQDAIETIRKAKWMEDQLTDEELDKLSQRIWDLHHFAEKLISQKPPESIFYDAKIIKQVLEEKFGPKNKSLLESADEFKKATQRESLKAAVINLAQKDELREVFFEDLEEIALELNNVIQKKAS